MRLTRGTNVTDPHNPPFALVNHALAMSSDSRFAADHAVLGSVKGPLLTVRTIGGAWCWRRKRDERGSLPGVR